MDLNFPTSRISNNNNSLTKSSPFVVVESSSPELGSTPPCLSDGDPDEHGIDEEARIPTTENLPCHPYPTMSAISVTYAASTNYYQSTNSQSLATSGPVPYWNFSWMPQSWREIYALREKSIGLPCSSTADKKESLTLYWDDDRPELSDKSARIWCDMLRPKRGIPTAAYTNQVRFSTANRLEAMAGTAQKDHDLILDWDDDRLELSDRSIQIRCQRLQSRGL